MKTLLVIFVGIVLFKTCSMESRNLSASTETSTPVADSVNFKLHIQPIFVKRCSPCHFEGGKMYDKMPFDQARTIIAHKESILKRIKEENENSLLKKFLEKNN